MLVGLDTCLSVSHTTGSPLTRPVVCLRACQHKYAITFEYVQPARQVVVAEGAPEYTGHCMARDLARVGVQTTLIPDSNVFAMMSRMTKARPRPCCQVGGRGAGIVHVCTDACTHAGCRAPGSSAVGLCGRYGRSAQASVCQDLTAPCVQVYVSAHALLANGGVMARVGTHLVALAAKRHEVPFVVLAGLHTLSPLFPHDPTISFNDFKVSRAPGASARRLFLLLTLSAKLWIITGNEISRLMITESFSAHASSSAAADQAACCGMNGTQVDHLRQCSKDVP